VDLTSFLKRLKVPTDLKKQVDLTLAIQSTTAHDDFILFCWYSWLCGAGTGNKVEDFGVGFYTKYGDGGVDLSPIADLMKSSVSLAAYLNVPESILNAAPSDGLFGDEKNNNN
jgi:NAD+ synthase